MTSAASIEALYATGHWLLEQGRHADAAVVFRAMALVVADDERAWLGLGECHERNGQPGIASELYRIGTEVAGPAVRCAIARGRVLRQLGREDLAAEAFAAAYDAAIDAGDDAMASIAQHEGVGQ